MTFATGIHFAGCEVLTAMATTESQQTFRSDMSPPSRLRNMSSKEPARSRQQSQNSLTFCREGTECFNIKQTNFTVRLNNVQNQHNGIYRSEKYPFE
jgi:hypothetical protein